jgi:hypothetical protein
VEQRPKSRAFVAGVANGNCAVRAPAGSRNENTHSMEPKEGRIMKIDGGCHCGYVTYEAEVDPEKVAICSCTDCQTLSGSAFRTIVFTRKDSFKLRSGTLKTYVKTAESGNKRPQCFCPECGTPIYATTVGDGPKVHAIRAGTARQRDELIPKVHIWYRSAQRWTTGLDSIPKIETQPILGERSGAE